VILFILVSAFTLYAKTNSSNGHLISKEHQSALILEPSHNVEGVYINTTIITSLCGKSLFYDGFILTAGLIQKQNPVEEFLLYQNPFIKENQKRTNPRFFTYLKN